MEVLAQMQIVPLGFEAAFVTIRNLYFSLRGWVNESRTFRLALGYTNGEAHQSFAAENYARHFKRSTLH